MFDEKPTGGGDRHFKIVVVDVEIEKAVIRAFELDQIANIAPPAQALAETFDLGKGRDAIGGAVKHQDGRQV